MNNQPYLLERLFKDTLVIFLLSMIVSIVGSITDGAITGSFLGTESIAAFGMTMPYQKSVWIFPLVMMVGMQVLCSKSLGGGDLRKANEIFSLAVTVAFAVAVLVMCGTLLFTNQLADLLGATEDLGEIRTLAIDFLKAYAFAVPAMSLISLLTPIMQLDSDRQRAVVSAAVLSGTAIIGDLLVVFVFGGGLWGIGVATTVSSWLTAGVLIQHFFKPEASFKFLPKVASLKYLKDTVLIGLPASLGLGSAVLRVGFFTRMAVAVAGGSGVAAYAAVENFLGLLTTIPKALGSSTQMIGGILINEHDRQSVLNLIKIALKYAFIITLTVAVGVFFAAPLIADLYVKDGNTQAYQMTVEGIRLCIAFLPIATVTAIFQYFHQAYGRYKMVSCFAILENIGFVVPIVLLLTPQIGISGIWLTFPLSSAAYLLTIFLVTCRHCGRITFKLDDYLLLPKDFDVPEDRQLSITVTSMDEVMNLSIRAQAFCMARGIDERRSKLSGLCIEEMAGNIVDYGFDDGKKHFVDIRVIIRGEQVILRLRDDCRPFNPKKWAELYNPDDPFSHIGIRIVHKMSTEFDYVNVLKLNNLLIKL
ncbi:MAG: ATP-binding protein [Quinella sp. 1Q7]|nr:ATP-binding protein [Quinella sp. 1Q7]